MCVLWGGIKVRPGIEVGVGGGGQEALGRDWRCASGLSGNKPVVALVSIEREGP